MRCLKIFRIPTSVCSSIRTQLGIPITDAEIAVLKMQANSEAFNNMPIARQNNGNQFTKNSFISRGNNIGK